MGLRPTRRHYALETLLNRQMEHCQKRWKGETCMKEQTILTEEVLAEIEQLEDEGYMYQVLDVINRFSNAGIERGDFRVSDVYTDLQVALHVAYADINIDDYEHYEHAERWLARTESKAAGCGVWYYRYSVSLM